MIVSDLKLLLIGKLWSLAVSETFKTFAMMFTVKLLSLLIFATHSDAKMKVQPEEDFVQCANSGKPKFIDFRKLKTEPYNDTYFFLTGKLAMKF